MCLLWLQYFCLLCSLLVLYSFCSLLHFMCWGYCVILQFTISIGWPLMKKERIRGKSGKWNDMNWSKRGRALACPEERSIDGLYEYCHQRSFKYKFLQWIWQEKSISIAKFYLSVNLVVSAIENFVIFFWRLISGRENSFWWPWPLCFRRGSSTQLSVTTVWL